MTWLGLASTTMTFENALKVYYNTKTMNYCALKIKGHQKKIPSKAFQSASYQGTNVEGSCSI